jgi:hypothetical protein
VKDATLGVELHTTSRAPHVARPNQGQPLLIHVDPNVEPSVHDQLYGLIRGRGIDLVAIDYGEVGIDKYAAVEAGDGSLQSKTLRANDDETKTFREFTLEGIGQTSSGYAPHQRQQDACGSRR